MARTSDPRATRSLEVIETQVKRAHQMLRDLMFVARPPRPINRPCRPADVLRACVREFHESCATRGVRLMSEIDDSIPVTWIDADGLRHVGDILLRNALQATPDGGKIQVRSAQSGSEFVWSFSNTGDGVSAEDALHLFDPFYCGRQAGRGLGLGLPRAARIVELSEGRLSWNSRPDSLTTFNMYMPIRSQPA